MRAAFSGRRARLYDMLREGSRIIAYARGASQSPPGSVIPAQPRPRPPCKCHFPSPDGDLCITPLRPVGSRFRGNDEALRRRGAALRAAWIPAYADRGVGYAKVSDGGRGQPRSGARGRAQRSARMPHAPPAQRKEHAMKLILSRKGFDSGAKSGRGPSPIFPDDTLFSLPIPAATRSSTETCAITAKNSAMSTSARSSRI